MSEKPTQMERDIDRETAGELDMGDTPITDTLRRGINLTMTPYESAYDEMSTHAESLELALAAKTAECERLRGALVKAKDVFDYALMGAAILLLLWSHYTLSDERDAALRRCPAKPAATDALICMHWEAIGQGYRCTPTNKATRVWL